MMRLTVINANNSRKENSNINIKKNLHKITNHFAGFLFYDQISCQGG